MSGDIRVLGLVAGTTLIEDIGMDVPHGVMVTIPAARAYASKDLWRAISQRSIIQLHTGPSHAVSATVRPPDTTEQEALRKEITRLQGEIVRLLSENTLLQEALAEAQDAQKSQKDTSHEKLDEVLNLLRAGGVAVPSSFSSPSVAAPRAHDVVSGEVPTFIPAQIKPEGVEMQIVTKIEESSGPGVQGAASALRKLRKSSGQ